MLFEMLDTRFLFNNLFSFILISFFLFVFACDCVLIMIAILKCLCLCRPKIENIAGGESKFPTSIFSCQSGRRYSSKISNITAFFTFGLLLPALLHHFMIFLTKFYFFGSARFLLLFDLYINLLAP